MQLHGTKSSKDTADDSHELCVSKRYLLPPLRYLLHIFFTMLSIFAVEPVCHRNVVVSSFYLLYPLISRLTRAQCAMYSIFVSHMPASLYPS